MMSFTFDFPSPDDACNEEDPKNGGSDIKSNSYPNGSSHGRGDEKKWLCSDEVLTFYDDQIVKQLSTTFMEFNDVRMKIIDTSCLETAINSTEKLKNTLGSSQVLNAISSNSDLVSASYEGGLKIWECGIDLANFMATHPLGRDIQLKDKTVLEVGCGAGLPGLYCMMKDAQCVHFQDYNEEVLKLLTHPNVLYNSQDSESPTTCRFFSGDWDSFTKFALKEKLKYDIIMSAETIYNEENYDKLHRLFDSLLSEGGKVFLAAKAYYFGVGGSIEGFCELVNQKNVFLAEEVYSMEKGVPRKILCLQRKTCSR